MLVIQATCMWNRLEAAQCCHLEMERQLTEEFHRQRQQRIAERMRRAAKRTFYTLLRNSYVMFICSLGLLINEKALLRRGSARDSSAAW